MLLDFALLFGIFLTSARFDQAHELPVAIVSVLFAVSIVIKLNLDGVNKDVEKD